jgi:hypothetical protein
VGSQLRWLFFGFNLVYEVTYVMDRSAYLAADVGVGIRVWRRGEFSPHSPGRRTRGIDRQRSSRSPRRLAKCVIEEQRLWQSNLAKTWRRAARYKWRPRRMRSGT